MNLIGRYSNSGYSAVADAVTDFYGRREDLRRAGVAFGADGDGEPAKQSTDISLVAIDRSEPESFALAQVILRGVSPGSESFRESDLQPSALRPG